MIVVLCCFFCIGGRFVIGYWVEFVVVWFIGVEGIECVYIGWLCD